MADEEQNLSVPRAVEAPVLTPESAIEWSCKNEILKVAAHAEQRFNEAVVVGPAESNELVALVFGYSPEGCHRRAVQIAANPALLASLKRNRAALDLIDPDRPLQYATTMDLMRKDMDAAIAQATGATK